MQQTFDAMVSGILSAIRLAHADLRAATLSVSSGNLPDTAVNRSPGAYLLNPAGERALYSGDIEETMVLLKVTEPGASSTVATACRASQAQGALTTEQKSIHTSPDRNQAESAETVSSGSSGKRFPGRAGSDLSVSVGEPSECGKALSGGNGTAAGAAVQGRGLVSWFAVHCTSLNNTNRLISGDNKGAAEFFTEALLGRQQGGSRVRAGSEMMLHC